MPPQTPPQTTGEIEHSSWLRQLPAIVAKTMHIGEIAPIRPSDVLYLDRRKTQIVPRQRVCAQTAHITRVANVLRRWVTGSRSRRVVGAIFDFGARSACGLPGLQTERDTANAVFLDDLTVIVAVARDPEFAGARTLVEIFALTPDAAIFVLGAARLGANGAVGRVADNDGWWRGVDRRGVVRKSIGCAV